MQIMPMYKIRQRSAGGKLSRAINLNRDLPENLLPVAEHHASNKDSLKSSKTNTIRNSSLSHSREQLIMDQEAIVTVSNTAVTTATQKSKPRKRVNSKGK